MHSLTILVFCSTMLMISSLTLKRTVEHEDQINENPSTIELCQKKTNDLVLQRICQNDFVESFQRNLKKKKRHEDDSFSSSSSSSSSIDDDDRKKMKKKRRSFVRRGLEKKFVSRFIGKRMI